MRKRDLKRIKFYANGGLLLHKQHSFVQCLQPKGVELHLREHTVRAAIEAGPRGTTLLRVIGLPENIINLLPPTCDIVSSVACFVFYCKIACGERQ